MVKARCTFGDCNSMIITIEDSKITTISDEIYDTFKLMQRNNMDDKFQNKFMVIDDVWDFDNIGVSKDIPDQSSSAIPFEKDNEKWIITKCVKYLICADCDKGPIGIVCEIEKDNSIKKTINLLSLTSISHD